jgi:effector-binding domain-containing protein
MTVTDSKPNELIKTRLEFGGAGGAVSDYRFEPAEGGTKVTWTFESDKTNNPMFRYMNVMMNGMLVNQFDSGLVAIKRIAESMPPPVKKPDLKIEATTTSDMNYLAIRDTANMSDIGQKMGTDYGMIQEAIKKQGLQMSGYPFAIYYTDSPDNFIMDVAIGVDKTGKAAGNVKPGILKSGNAVVAHYFGNYDKMNEAYSSIKEWLSTNNKKVSGSSWEVYVWSPMTEKDTAKWQTDIYFPVE